MIKLAENRTASDMGTRKITPLMNKKFKEEGRKLTINHMASCRILNKNL